MRIISRVALCAALGLLGCPDPEGDSEVCGALTVVSRVDVDAARNCGEINGNLTLLGGMAEITASDFPNLTRINGDLVVTTFDARQPLLTRLTLGALQTVRGKLQIVAHAALQTASFPTLTTIGTAGAGVSLDVIQTTLRQLDLPALTTVEGSVRISDLGTLCSVSMRRVARVSGSVQIDKLPNVPFSALRALSNSAGGGANVAEVGCCFALDSSGCTQDWSHACSSAACP